MHMLAGRRKWRGKELTYRWPRWSPGVTAFRRCANAANSDSCTIDHLRTPTRPPPALTNDGNTGRRPLYRWRECSCPTQTRDSHDLTGTTAHAREATLTYSGYTTMLCSNTAFAPACTRHDSFCTTTKRRGRSLHFSLSLALRSTTVN